MIPFFRKIRKKLADDNQFFKYSRYAIGEIVLVVVGILIALQINNWNEEMEVQRKLNMYLMMLSKELKSNLNRMDFVINLANEHSEYNLQNIKKLNSDSAKLFNSDSLAFLFEKGPMYKMELERTVFDDLINSGIMENVKDSLLRRQIFRIETILKNYDQGYRNMQVIWEEQIRPYHIEHYNESRLVEGLSSISFKADLEAFIYNRKYANILAGNIIFANNYKSSIIREKELFTTILSNVRIYLNN